MAFWIASAALVVTGASALASLSAERIWEADVVCLFMPYLVAASFAGLLLALLSGRRSAMIGGAALVVSTGWLSVAPWAVQRLGSAERGAADRGTIIRVATFNCLGSNRDVADFASWARRAKIDVLVLQEVPGAWRTTLDDLSDVYPWRAGKQAETRDVDILSRLPLSQVETLRPTPDTRVAVAATVRLEGRALKLFAVHPNTLRTRAAWKQRNDYLERFGQWFSARAAGRTALAAGDWNTPPWSPYFGRLVTRTGLRAMDARAVAQPTRILGSAFGMLFGSPIDHVFGSRGVRSLGCEIGPDLRSDHRPLECRLRIPRLP